MTADNVSIDLPSYRVISYELPPAEANALLDREMKRTAYALQAVGEPFSPEGRIRWVALWRAWPDGAAAVFHGDPEWSETAAELYHFLDRLMDYLEGQDVPHIDKLFRGSGDV